MRGGSGKSSSTSGIASHLADLRDELRLGLSDGASEEARGKVGELAERIRELRAANEVEAAPERTGVRKVVRAERPVTARIRERMGEVEARADETGPDTMPKPVAEIIPSFVAKPIGEHPVDNTSSTPPAVALEVVMPIIYQGHGHAGQIMRRRQRGGMQLRWF